MTATTIAERNNLLQHDAPIIREASSIEDASREASDSNRESSNPESNEKPSSNEQPGPSEKPGRAIEIGGRDGPEPTRYGDWEKGGRCIDF